MGKSLLSNLRLVVVLVALCALCAIYVVQKTGYRKGADPLNEDISYIKLDGKITLSIPKDYLTDREARRGGDVDIVRIRARLPNLEAAPVRREGYEQDLVFISLQTALDVVEPLTVEGLQPYLDETGFGISKLNDSYYEARAEGKIYTPAFSKYNEYFLAYFADGRHARIVCEKKIPRCTVYTRFDDIFGTYMMDRSYVPEKWKEVDDKVLELIGNFRRILKQEK